YGSLLSPSTMFSVDPSMSLQSIVKRCEGPNSVPTCLTVVLSPLCGCGPVPAIRSTSGRNLANGCSRSTTCQLPYFQCETSDGALLLSMPLRTASVSNASQLL